ncbi:hypothetical protein GUJ93_ZPchr0013g37629 [Zizania palustris]|uniref:Uncharacterized protein n=1 Tax=Zizania palustris TaxID=103762 RepID=A0A8J6C3U7_ZIZPA|nr:hypothetical protein GUJ93_ZPchr0013g37629 [Zizania palustris]
MRPSPPLESRLSRLSPSPSTCAATSAPCAAGCRLCYHSPCAASLPLLPLPVRRVAASATPSPCATAASATPPHGTSLLSASLILSPFLAAMARRGLDRAW